MKVPANLPGDKLIFDYLSRVTEAGLQYLPKGDRMAFVGRTRARIERECGPAGSADPGRVADVLARLGEPEELVRAERARINAEWLRRRAKDAAALEAVNAAREAAEAAAREAAEATATAPRPLRLIQSRGKPDTQTQPLPRSPGQPRRFPGQRRGIPRTGRARGPGPAAGSTAPGPGPAAGPLPVPPSIVPGIGPEPSPPSQRPSPAPVLPGDRVEAFVRRAGVLARANVLESAALVLFVLGGLVFPFPFPGWLAGFLLALPSRLWDQTDKWVALIGPPACAALITVPVAVIARGHGNVIAIYSHVLFVGIGYTLRMGCLLCAFYLGWRVHRGRRVRLPPWRR